MLPFSIWDETISAVFVNLQANSSGYPYLHKGDKDLHKLSYWG